MKSERDSLAFFIGFEKLIDLRVERGITLEQMSKMLADMAEVDPAYVAVSEEELRAVESDPCHGMSIPAAMYARFLGAKAEVKQMNINGELRTRMIEKKTENKKQAVFDRLDALSDMDGGYASPAFLILSYNDHDGTKRQIHVPVGTKLEFWERIRDLFKDMLNDQLEVLDDAAASFKGRVGNQVRK